MSRRSLWEAAPPPELRRASWKNAPRLWRISLAGLVRLFRRHRLMLVLCGVYGALGVIGLGLGLFVGGTAGWSLLLMWCVAVTLCVISSLVVTLWAVVFRLTDPRRFVALSDDRTAVLDVVALTRNKQRHVRLENHARLSSSTSAAALRQTVSAWVLDLHSRGRRLDASAQNMSVARLYEGQFPDLIAIGPKDRWGHVRLEVKARPQ